MKWTAFVIAAAVAIAGATESYAQGGPRSPLVSSGSRQAPRDLLAEFRRDFVNELELRDPLSNAERVPAYFDLTFTQGCTEQNNPLARAALRLVDSQRRGWVTSDELTYVVSLIVSDVRDVKLLETPIISFSRTRRIDTQEFDCGLANTLAYNLANNSDLKLKFKFYATSRPNWNSEIIAGLREAARFTGFLLKANVITDAAQPLVDGAIKSLNEADKKRGAFLAAFDREAGIPVQNVTFRGDRKTLRIRTAGQVFEFRKEVRKSAFALLNDDGTLLNADEDPATTFQRRIGVNLVAHIEASNSTWRTALAGSDARATCNAIRTKVRTLLSSLNDQALALHMLLSENADLLDGKAQFHCLTRNDVQRLVALGLRERPPYAEAYANAGLPPQRFANNFFRPVFFRQFAARSSYAATPQAVVSKTKAQPRKSKVVVR